MAEPSPRKKEIVSSEYIYPVTNKMYLNRNFPSRRLNYFELVRKRKSSQKLKRMNESLLPELLWYSCKSIDIAIEPSGYIWSHRPAPSAGGRHPIDIVVSTPKRIDKRNLSLYNPIDHSLSELNLDAKHTKKFFIEVNKVLKIDSAIVIWFVAHLKRTESKYLNSMSLLWRDVGALLYCIQIACTALGLSSCPIGRLGESRLSRMFNNKKIIGVGGIILGGMS